ncbi:MAG: polysaccharide biosynthesis tyrosine autokinase, partial [Planctomycetia bacterium]|nr:polysaccharide biosynthesis tyrosine autokinase [Planctomycetia bacterium]
MSTNPDNQTPQETRPTPPENVLRQEQPAAKTPASKVDSSNLGAASLGARTTTGSSSTQSRSSSPSQSGSPTRSRRRRSARNDKNADALLQTSTTSGAPVRGGRELNFFDVIGILQRQAIIVVITTVACTALAGWYFTTQPKKYAASSSIYIPATNSASILSSVDRNNTQGISNTLRGDKIETHALIVKSNQILSKTWEEIKSSPEKLSRMSKEMSEANLDDVKAVRALNRMLTVRVGGDNRDFKNTNTITISCTSGSPSEAAEIVNTVVEQYQKYFEDKYNRNNIEVSNAITESKSQLEADIEARKADLFEYIHNSEITFIGSEENNPLLTALTKMSENMVDIDFQILRLQNRLASLEEAISGRDVDDISESELIALMSGGEGETILNTIIGTARGSSSAEVTALSATIGFVEQTTSAQLMKLRNDLNEAEKKYAADHPTVQTLREQIARLEAEQDQKRAETSESAGRIGVISYQELFVSYLSAIKRRVEELNDEKQKINEYVTAKDDDVRKITEYRETIEAKKLSIESLKAMQEHLEQSLKQLALMSDVNTYQVEVLSAAEENRTPVYPSLVKFVAVGFVLGFLIGVALAYVVDITDATFHSPNEIVRSLHIPIITQLQSFKSKLKDVTPKQRAKNKAEHKPDPELIAYYKADDPVCEVFRQIRTRLFNKRRDGGCLVVMNTSPHPSDGKTMILSNIAVKVAEAGMRVLLIDGDMRKPDLHKMFGVDNEVGLSDVLAGGATIDDASQPTVVKNLTIMTAGKQRKHTAKLISSETFDETIKALREMYDVVLIDTPPVLYVNDAPTIAPRVDGVLYIFRIRRGGRPDVITGVKSLADVGANILGCIVNCHGKHKFYNDKATIEESYGGYGGYGG